MAINMGSRRIIFILLLIIPFLAQSQDWGALPRAYTTDTSNLVAVDKGAKTYGISLAHIAAALSSGVGSFNGRTGTVVPVSTDYNTYYYSISNPSKYLDSSHSLVKSVFGRLGVIVATTGDYNTSQVTELTNLYFTNARSRAALSESEALLTYNNSTGVFGTTISGPALVGKPNSGSGSLQKINLGTGLSFSNDTLKANVPAAGVSSYNGRTGTVVPVSGDYTTTTVPEGSNLYWTTTRGHSAFSGVGPLTYNSTTGAFGITNVSPSVDGYLSSTQYNSLLTKESPLTFNPPLSRTVNTVSIPEGTSSVDGYLPAAKYVTWEAKQDAINIPTNRLAGRWSAGTGQLQAVTISTGLNLDASGNLTATGVGGVSSVFGRTGTVTAQSTDYASYYYSVSNPANYITLTAARAGLSTSGTLLNYDNSTGVFSTLYTAENISNKNGTGTLGTSSTVYPAENTIRAYITAQNFVNLAAARAGISSTSSFVLYNNTTGVMSTTYTPENTVNKNTSDYLSNSTTRFPSDHTVKHYSDSIAAIIGSGGFVSPLTTKGDLLGFGSSAARLGVGATNTVVTADPTSALGVSYKTIPAIQGYTSENTTNKANDLLSPNSVKYTTSQAVVNGLALKQDIIPYTTENISNKNASPYVSSSTTKYVSDYTLRSQLDSIRSAGRELTVSGPLSFSGVGTFQLKGSDGLPILGSDGLPLIGGASGNNISIAKSDSTVDGYLSKEDWLYFYHKGDATSGITESDPQYNSFGVPKVRTITINGTTLDLSANRSWTIATGGTGTVTSLSSGNASGLFSTSVSTATTTPAISYSLSSQTQNNVFAAPSFSSGPPSFRPLVAGDIPVLPSTKITGLATVATTGNYSDISGKPSFATVAITGDYNNLINLPGIPAAQINADWNSTGGLDQIFNKPTLSAVATAGTFVSLTSKPTTLSGYGITDAYPLSSNPAGYLTAASLPASRPFADNLSLVKNSTDPTKQIIFSAANLTTATTRNITFQDASYLVAGTDINNNFSIRQSFPSGITTNSIQTTTLSIAYGTGSSFLINESLGVYSGGTAAFHASVGTTAQRPTSTLNGAIRYNTSTLKFEFYENGAWVNYSTSGGSGITSLTTTGTSGPATFSGGVLNIPQYTGGGGGTLTAVSVASANGFTGSSSGGATPILTLGTSATGILKGNGTAISAATAGTDYQAPITLTTTGSGAATFSGGVLNIPTPSGAGSSPPFSDINPLVKNFTDATKQLILNTSLIGTGQIRVLSAQNASYTMAGTDITNSFTKYQKFTSAAFSSVPFPGDFGYDGTHWYGATPAGNLQLDNQLSLLTTTMINSLYGYTPANPSTVINTVAFGSTPNSNGGSISTNTLTLQPADATHPGGVSTTTQTIPGDKTFTGTTTVNDFIVKKHLIGWPGGVTGSLGTAGGSSSGGSYNLDINCSDLSGKISLTTGTSLSGTDVITVTFLTPYTIAPYVTFSPGNSIAANFVGLYVTSTTTGFTIKNGAGSLAASTGYVWTYTVSQ